MDTLDVARPTSSVARAWSHAWTDRRFRLEALLSAVALVSLLAAMARFLAWVERRPGVVLEDPVLSAIPPRDVTWITFGLIYAGLITAVVVLLPHPRRLVLGMQAYVTLMLMRVGAMAVTPLEPPPGMIALRDPLVQIIGTGQVLTRDLFFSGHTSTMFLLALLAPGRATRAFFLGCTALVGICVLWQHVHYTVDVLVAPLFAFVSVALVSRVHDGLTRRR